MVKKYAYQPDDVWDVLDDFQSHFTINLLSYNTIRLSVQFMKQYQFSYWDSLILASALESACETLYTEDMHHDQLIEKKTRIINPFLQATP